MHSSEHGLKRSLGPFSAISITVGAVIGSGIFFKALDVAQGLPTSAWIYATWAVLGLVCLFGAFAYAELGAMLPEAGGMYAFLRESWGRFPAFLYGWTFFFAINSGTLAALAAIFAENLADFLGLSAAQETALAIAMIVALAVANHLGVRFGALLQNLSTSAKLLALAAIVVAGFAVDGGAPSAVASTTAAPEFSLAGLVSAAVAIFWAYEGWYQLPYNAAELENPARDLPRGLIWGVAILIVVYVLVNAIYLRVVPLEEMRTLGRAEVPQQVIARSFGASWSSWLAVLISISVLGAANPNLLSSPRGFYAMARDGLMPRVMMHVDRRFATPTVAIWSQALWSIGLILFFEGFKELTDYVVFASLLFYALTVAAVYVLRVRAPRAERPYRCWGYPFTPALFIAVTLFVDVQTFFDPTLRRQALYGLGIIGVGALAYLPLLRRSRA
ncbi:MAG: amino acid permease [Planctomycetes bacterium]|nr:amino acid permease [Planctomycetota bacterium]